MRFDDRLLTVLNQPADDRHDAAVRWRQLVDLVARAGASSDSPVVAQALDAIRAEGGGVDESLRAAAARSVAALPLPFALLEVFASDRLAVAAPVLAAASLDPQQWRALQGAADPETRAFIASLHPHLPDSEPAATSVLVAQPPPAESASSPGAAYMPPSLHEVVERIERRRQLRAADARAPSEAEQAPAEPPALFRWECDPGGEIAWVEGAPRGPLIGRSIAKAQDQDGDRIDREIVRAFSLRAPFRDAALTVAGAGAVSGEWKLSAVPAFDPADGRFAGYRGVALRDAPKPAVNELVMPEALADPDSLRELVHEIKTPLNAIIGFAEIIEGQYLGPADRGYRDRAAEIVRQARLLLTGIDDLDFAAKIHSAAGASRGRAELTSLVDREMDELRRLAAIREVEIAVIRARTVTAAVQPELAERLLFRLISTLIAEAASGEQLQLNLDARSGEARLSVSRPAALRGIPDATSLSGASGAGGEGGFALQLVRGLARIAGGDLVGNRDTFALVFPGAG